MLAKYNIPDQLRGDTWPGFSSIVITTGNNTPVSLSGASIKMQFREDIDSPVALELSTENSGVVIVNPVIGEFKVPPTIIDIPFGEYNYDIQVTFADGTVKTYVTGSWNIIADITQ